MNNQGAWTTASKTPLEISSAPYISPDPNEVIIKNAAVGITIGETALQDAVSTDFYKPQKYPCILGYNVAGTVEEVGTEVHNVKKGQRVTGYANFYADWEFRHGSFQNYVTIASHMLSIIPDNLPFTNAAVLPLSISTATHGLFSKETLGLRFPPHAQDDKVLIVWGGSSSVGSSAIQLAAAAGYKVLAAASSKNHAYVKNLGAQWAVDYSSPTVEDDILKLLKGKEVVGAFNAIGVGKVTKSLAEIFTKIGGGVITATLPYFEELPKGVTCKFMNASLTVVEPGIAEAVWGGFVPKGLANGTFQAKPDPLVMGGGLEGIQAGLDRVKQGMSAAVVVVSFE